LRELPFKNQPTDGSKRKKGRKKEKEKRETEIFRKGEVKKKINVIIFPPIFYDPN